MNMFCVVEDMKSIEKIIDKRVGKKYIISDLSEMLNHESGRSNYKVLTDIELCSLVDKEILPLRGKRSIYELSVHEKLELLKQICTKTHIPESRVCRCLAM